MFILYIWNSSSTLLQLSWFFKNKLGSMILVEAAPELVANLLCFEHYECHYAILWTVEMHFQLVVLCESLHGQVENIQVYSIMIHYMSSLFQLVSTRPYIRKRGILLLFKIFLKVCWISYWYQCSCQVHRYFTKMSAINLFINHR